MKPKNQRLVLVSAALVAVLVASLLAMWGLRSQASYFYTPADVVARLNSEVNESLKSAELRASMIKVGFEPTGGSPQDFAALIAARRADERGGAAVLRVGRGPGHRRRHRGFRPEGVEEGRLRLGVSPKARPAIL